MNDRFPNVSDQGDTVNFFSCLTCGAAVKRQDRETHDEWHERLRRCLNDGRSL